MHNRDLKPHCADQQQRSSSSYTQSFDPMAETCHRLQEKNNYRLLNGRHGLYHQAIEEKKGKKNIHLIDKETLQNVWVDNYCLLSS